MCLVLSIVLMVGFHISTSGILDRWGVLVSISYAQEDSQCEIYVNMVIHVYVVLCIVVMGIEYLCI